MLASHEIAKDENETSVSNVNEAFNRSVQADSAMIYISGEEFELLQIDEEIRQMVLKLSLHFRNYNQWCN